MKDVGQLVHDHESLPAVVRLQRGIGGGRDEQNREAVGWIRRRKAVGCVEVVGQRQIDDAPRLVQLRRQQPVGALGFRRCFERLAAVGWTEVDPEMRRVKRAPGA